MTARILQRELNSNSNPSSTGEGSAVKNVIIGKKA